MTTAMRGWGVALFVWVAVGPRLFAADPTLELVVQTGHRNEVNAVALSEDGKFVLTGSEDKTAILWDGATGTQLRTFRGHTDKVGAVALSRDGQRVLTGSVDHTAILWDAVTGKKLQTFKGDETINAVALSSDGKRVLTGSGGLPEHGTAVLWDVATGDKVRTFSGHTHFVNAVALSEDGKRVLTGSWDKTAILWDAATGKPLQTFRGPNIVESVALSGDGQRVLTSYYMGSAVLWDGASGAKLQTFSGSRAALSSDGKRVLTGSYGTATLWNAATGDKIQTFAGHKDWIWAVALSRDGKRAVTGGRDKSAMLWDTASGDKLQTFHGRSSSVFTAALSRDGKRLLTGSDGSAIVWDAVSGEKIRTLPVGGFQSYNAALSGDGKRVLTGYSRNPTLWDADSGKELRELKGHTGEIRAATLSADGKRALTGSFDDGKVILWDTDSGKQLYTTPKLVGFAALALSPDGKRMFVSADFDFNGDPWLSDGDIGKVLQTFKGHKSSVDAAALSADGKRVLTGSFDTTAILWDGATGAKLQTYRAHSSPVEAVALSDDGRRALTGAEDGTLFLWDADKADPLRTLRGHTDKITAVVFSSDGKRAVTSSDDGTTRFWDVATGEELCRLISIDEGKDWLVVTPDGLFDGSVNAQRLVAYRLAGTLEFVPLEKYRHFYYTPGLFAKIMRGERPRPKVDIAKALPPKVRIIRPAQAAAVKDGSVEVKAEAESRGDHPVIALHLLLDGRPYQGQKSRFRVEAPKPGRVETSWSVELGPGAHRLQVLADTRLVEGIASEEVEVRYVGGEAQVELPTLYVLAVGISQYNDKQIPTLDYAADDARAVAAAYAMHSKALFRKVEQRVLTDKDATREAILDGLKWLRTEATQRDYVVFFFAGHGEKDDTGTLYFLPSGADLKRLDSTGIHQDQLKGQLVNLPGKVTAILDACHAGRFADSGKKRSAAGLTDDLLRELMAAENGLVVLCAATGNESALESRAYKHGIFAQALLEGLAGQEITVGEGAKARKLRAQPDRDGAVFFHQLEAFLYERVKDLSRGQQHPIVFKPDGIRTFPVSKP